MVKNGLQRGNGGRFSNREKSTWARTQACRLVSYLPHRHWTSYYNSNFETVVRRYAGAFIRRGDTMELLYRADGAKSCRFSSWIPYWTREDFPQTISTWYGAEGSFSASGESSISACVLSSDEELLVVRGIEVDKITWMGTSNTQNNGVISFINYLCTEINSLKAYPSGKAIEDVKLKLPICNAGHPHLESPRQLLLSTNVVSGGEPSQQSENFNFSGDKALFASMPTV
jgi:hypothetical protein